MTHHKASKRCVAHRNCKKPLSSTGGPILQPKTGEANFHFYAKSVGNEVLLDGDTINLEIKEEDQSIEI